VTLVDWLAATRERKWCSARLDSNVGAGSVLAPGIVVRKGDTEREADLFAD
jgi:hypothetical protein